MTRFIYYTYFAFFILGAVASAIGVTLTWFDAFFPNWSKETLLFMRFAGALLGGAFLIAKVKASPFAYPLLFVSTLMLLIPNNTTGIIAFFIGGVAAVIAAIFHNTQIPILIEDAEQKKKVMNLAQLMFGLGAAFFPFTMYVLSRIGLELSTIVFSNFICLSITLVILGILFKDTHSYQKQESHQNNQLEHQKESSSLLFLGIYLAAFFLYAGVENGLTGYLHSWVLEYFAFDAEHETYLIYSLYWLSLTAGRLWGYFLSFRMSSFQIVMLNSVGMVFASVMIISGYIILGVMLLALNVGPMFANLYLLIYRSCGVSERISACNMTASGVGSLLVGSQLNRVLDSFFQVIILLVVVMAMLVAVVEIKYKKQIKSQTK